MDSGLRTPQELLPVAQRQAAPELLVRDLGGAGTSIPGGSGKPLLVVFWASW